MSQFQDPITVLDAKASNGIGAPVYIAGFRFLILALNTTGNTSATIKMQVSLQQDMPDFSAAQSPTNQWDYVRIVDMQNNGSLDGDVGVALVGTDDNRQFDVQLNGGMWFNAIVSGWTAGAITLKALPRNDD